MRYILPAEHTEAEAEAYLASWQPVRDEFNAAGLHVFGFDPGVAFHVDGISADLRGPPLKRILVLLRERREALEEIQRLTGQPLPPSPDRISTTGKEATDASE